MSRIYEWWKEASRPMWPPGAEIQAQAYDAFDAWRKVRDPDGDLSILDAIDLYAANEQTQLGTQT